MQPRPGALGPHGVLRSPGQAPDRARLGRRVRGRLATPRRAVPPSPQPPRLPARTSPSRRRSDDLARARGTPQGIRIRTKRVCQGTGTHSPGYPIRPPRPQKTWGGPGRFQNCLPSPEPTHASEPDSASLLVGQSDPAGDRSVDAPGEPPCAGLSVLRGRERRSRGAQADRTPQLSAGSSGYPQRVLLGLARIGVPPGGGR